MDHVLDKSAYMKEWRARKELEDPGYLDREREKASLRQAERLARLSQDPEWVEKERLRKAEAMRKKRADSEQRAVLNARKRELAQRPEAKQKQADRMKDWKSKNSDQVSAYQKQWREENARHVDAYMKTYMAEYLTRPKVQTELFKRNLWQNYRMTPAEFNDLWALQSGKCVICEVMMQPRGRQNDSVAVDHNHQTGVVRGLLCQQCNRGIGAFKDNPQILRSAAKYLEERGDYGSK
jgi:hypothetical protein